MRAVVQRVSRASVRVDGNVVGQINAGLLVLLGVRKEDSTGDADYLVDKIANLRIFRDAEGKMNLSLKDTGGALLVVSQFTLYGSTLKGRRPSFDRAANPEAARQLYQYFIDSARRAGISVECGQFQAMMEVELINDGPVTLLCDSERQL